MPRIARLGHVALPAENPAELSTFYEEVLGLTLVETNKDFGLTFLSSHPDEVNHDLSFAKSPKLAHIAYEVDSLATLRAFHRDLKRRGVKILYVLNFGWSIGMTFEDPEGNKVELFWSTGRKTPTRTPIDIEQPDEAIEAILDAVPVR